MPANSKTEGRASYHPTIDFSHTAFNQLMQKRIRKVLIISSNYDFFMLEEDGRIDEQIFNEYVSLNLRYPPAFVKAASSAEAFKIMEKGDIDLVIRMPACFPTLLSRASSQFLVQMLEQVVLEMHSMAATYIRAES